MGHRINTRDVLSGLILLGLGLAGLYFNQEHAIGTARRMGPGYMPMLAFVGLTGIGAFVTFAAFFTGPNPVGNWSRRNLVSLFGAIIVSAFVYLVSPSVLPFFGIGYNAVGIAIVAGMLVLTLAPDLRFIALISASVAVFGLLLEQIGFFAALTGTILLSCAAEREHFRKPLGVLGLIVFMLALCWWVFILQLDIRVHLWPTI